MASGAGGVVAYACSSSDSESDIEAVVTTEPGGVLGAGAAGGMDDWAHIFGGNSKRTPKQQKAKGKRDEICQRLLSLSMLAKSMDFKDIFGEVNNVLARFGLDPARCVGFMLDGCAANMKALMALTTHCRNAVGMRCMSDLFNNAGDQIESTQIDKFAGALQTVLSVSHNASEQWRAATGMSPPKAPSHRWASSFERNDKLVTDWQHAKHFIDKFSSSDETRSAKAAFCREELARLGQYCYHQEFWLQLEFALAVDLGAT
ncbi:unnamed protein product [Ectocarpus sp. CCAP 1310/34]|nr:unnamed protein product [Ectocarpus sp. CCAP 1310/34]